MQTEIMEEGFTICDLEVQKFSLKGRINSLEADLTQAFEADQNEQASKILSQIVLRRLIEVERSYLMKVDYELELRKQAIGKS